MPIGNLLEQHALLQAWSERLPVTVAALLDGRDVRSTAGERHGTWMLRVEWRDDPLVRQAELGLTNPEATPDETTDSAVVSTRASATTDARFVAEVLYERRRSLSRIPNEFLEQQLAAAVQRAASYTPQSLIAVYELGSPPAEATV